jgi:acyl carrier protein
LANSEVWVLDREGQLAPVGVVGELYIGGDGIAREYLGRPELTAETFVPHPFSKKPGARLYRTGDLVRYLSDGNIEFLKRVDHQIKIRGFRVELGEIEAVLQEHPAVCERVVVTWKDASGDTRLVAYVVGAQVSQAPLESELVPQLRSWLRERLPDHFIPSYFVVLDRLPLTPNGKVDREALPAPDCAITSSEETLIAPRTPEEEKIAEIWVELLNLDRVGVESNFFDLGGHSLVATRLVTRVREAFGINPPLRLIFESPTIAALAEFVATVRERGEVSRIEAMVEELTHLSDEETKSLLRKAGSQ